MPITDFEIDPNANIQKTKLADGKNVLGNPTSTFPLGQRSTGGLFSPRSFPGVKAKNILRIAANVVAGETITIGPMLIQNVSVTDVFVIEQLTTDTTRTGVGAMDNTSNPVLLTLSGAPAVAVSVGDMLRSTNEIFKVLRVISTTQYVLARARGGTTIATHANGDGWFQAAVPTTNISLPFNATLTPAVAGPCIAAEITNAISGTERAASRTSRVFKVVKATSLQAGAEVLLETLNPEAQTAACTETLAGANNVWAAAAMYGGAAPAAKRSVFLAIVPNATEVAEGFIRVPLDFTPSYWIVTVRVTASGLATAWVGASLFAAGVLSIDNTGATDWATTDTVYVEAHE